MNVLGISGSPRRGGITETLLDKALEGAGSTGALIEKLILNELDIKPCQECGDSAEAGKCAIPDDMRMVRERFAGSDAFIIASPVFFGSVTAQLKAMIDRFQSEWVAKYLLKSGPIYKNKRKGIFICTAGQDKIEYLENSSMIIKLLFKTLDIDYCGGLFFGGLNTKSEDESEISAMSEKAFELGRILTGA